MSSGDRLTGDALLLHGLFRSEIHSQCRFAELAAQRLDEGLANQDRREIWAAIQSILVAAASISKLLWGSSGTAEQMKQREPIRRLGRVGEDSPLRPRKIRNSLEHFDERIEAWVAKPRPANVFSSRRVGPDSSVDFDGHYYFGHYEPSTGIVTFGEDSISLPELLAEIARIMPHLRLPGTET